LRIIAGQYRSRRLKSLPGMDLRPTSDRLRETLFNVVAPQIPGSVWIDVFAGTGAVGIEALSRGARQVYFVEAAKASAALIRDNLKSLDVTEGFEVIERDAEKGLRLLDSEALGCDFCFLDPPYRDQQAYSATLGFLSTSRLLSASSIVIAEHEKHFDPGDSFGALQRYRTLRQGDAVLSFYRLQ